MSTALSKLRSWIVRHRDQNLVSYNRFGRPGEEEDDRPVPTTILVAPFNENAREFSLLGCWHVQKAAVAVACFGMSMVILFSTLWFFEFDWWSHTRGVDVTNLLGILVYLALGVLVHYYVLYGIKLQTAHFLLPFILTYSVICIAEAAGCLVLLLRIGDPELPMHSSAFFTITVMVVGLTIQVLMLYVVLKCRQFISLKSMHDMEIRVAEKSRSDNPSLRIVVAGSEQSATQLSPDAQQQRNGSSSGRPTNSVSNDVP